MSKEALSVVDTLKLALEALESCYSTGDYDEYQFYDDDLTIPAIAAIKAALETHKALMSLQDGAQPDRTWVGLTDEDKEEYVAQDFGGNRLDAMDWAEQRLKEKNTNSGG